MNLSLEPSIPGFKKSKIDQTSSGEFSSGVPVRTNRCFDLIHIFPDAILKWIGWQTQLGTYGFGEEKAAAKFERAASGAEQVMGPDKEGMREAKKLPKKGEGGGGGKDKGKSPPPQGTITQQK